MSMVCIIPARGGSTRLANKNILPLAGKPLINWTIEQALEADIFDDIVIDSDSEEIFDAVSLYSEDTELHKRTGYTNSFKTVQESILDCLVDIDAATRYDSACIMLPTCPIRSILDIQGQYRAFYAGHHKALLTACKYDKPLEWAMSIDYRPLSNVYLPILDNTDLTARSQDCKTWIYPSGSVWMVDIESFMAAKTVYMQGFAVYLIDKMYGIDIDTKEDFDMAEMMRGGAKFI